MKSGFKTEKSKLLLQQKFSFVDFLNPERNRKQLELEFVILFLCITHIIPSKCEYHLIPLFHLIICPCAEKKIRRFPDKISYKT